MVVELSYLSTEASRPIASRPPLPLAFFPCSMSVVAPTREQILMLYRAHLATARSFASYNFREYFVRRTRDQFRALLYPETSSAAENVNASNSLLSNVPTTNKAMPSVQPMSADKLSKFYQEATEELQVLQRAAITNRMYVGERLVVEDEAHREWIVRSSDDLGREAAS